MTKIWNDIKFAAPDVSFAIFIVAVLVFGSIYIHWALAIVVAGVILKNRLEAINTLEFPNDEQGSTDW